MGHLEHLLASPRFSSSKRYSSFLRYVVNQTVDGKAHELKERSLGIEVFGRNPSYDTNADPTVRVTASEVRKKLAQYYYEHSDTGGVRIDLPLGSYAPEFHFSPLHLKPSSVSNPIDANTTTYRVAPASGDATLVSPPAIQPEAPRQRRRWIPWAVAFGAALLIVFCTISWFRRPSPSAMDLFWAPVINSPNAILICMGQFRSLRANFDPNGYTSRPGSASQSAGGHDIVGLFWAQAPGDSTAEARVAGVLQSAKKRMIIRGESSTTFEDLRLVPSILIGAFNNNWTIRATDKMRFRFQLDTKSDEWWVEDTAKPDKRIGLLSAEQMAKRGRADSTDYAIIARQYDAETRQPTVVIAGLGINGTMAASEFATTPQYMEELAKHAPRDWYRKNMEIVVAVDVVTGTASAPRVVESYFW